MNFGEKLESDYVPFKKLKENIDLNKNFHSIDDDSQVMEKEIIKTQDASALEKIRDSLGLKNEAIKKLEDESLLIGTESRVSMLLSAEGLKPVSLVHVGEKNIEELKKIAKNLGLYFSVSDEVSSSYNPQTGKSYKSVAFYLAKEKALLDNYLKGPKRWKVNSGETTDEGQKQAIHDQAGNEYGYPKTAVDAFVNKKPRMELKDYPEEIRNSELGSLLNRMQIFIKSKENWQKELEVYSSWMDKVKELSPKIYQMILEMKPNAPEGDESKKQQSFSDKIKNIFSKYIKK